MDDITRQKKNEKMSSIQMNMIWPALCPAHIGWVITFNAVICMYEYVYVHSFIKIWPRTHNERARRASCWRISHHYFYVIISISLSCERERERTRISHYIISPQASL